MLDCFWPPRAEQSSMARLYREPPRQNAAAAAAPPAARRYPAAASAPRWPAAPRPALAARPAPLPRNSSAQTPAAAAPGTGSGSTVPRRAGGRRQTRLPGRQSARWRRTPAAWRAWCRRR
ncbi:hypothetical protein G6F23_014818 [Rhizopus arrhizus]|nr:hypothetical protein G6F23_014818 [Rhizopus arrhizus]